MYEFLEHIFSLLLPFFNPFLHFIQYVEVVNTIIFHTTRGCKINGPETRGYR